MIDIEQGGVPVGACADCATVESWEIALFGAEREQTLVPVVGDEAVGAE